LIAAQKVNAGDGVSEAGLECLVVKTNTLEATVLPELGGKVASLRYKGMELLQAPLRAYALRTPGMAFEASDASGMDECLPSVAACTVKTAGGMVQIPDHGEFWQRPCAVERRCGCEVKLTATGGVFPLRLERTLRVEGSGLRIDYRLENVGEVEVPYVWSAHPLFAVEEGDAIVLPESVRELIVEGSAAGRLGAKGSVVTWPVAETRGGARVDLSRAGKPGDEVGDKVYGACPLSSLADGWAAIERRQAGVRVQVGFDAVLTPHLGLWFCYGGWPEGQEKRQQCVALEPCSAPVDSLAEALERGWARILAPGQAAKWWMTIAVSELL